METLMREQVDIDNMQLGFMPECITTNTISIWDGYRKNIYQKLKNLSFGFVDLGNVFDHMHKGAVW